MFAAVHESAPRTTSRSEERCASGKKSTKRFDDRSFKRRRKARVLLSVRRDAITRDRYGPDERERERVVRRPSKVEKYVMSDEACEKREGTYRQWREKKRRRPDVDVTKRTTETEKPKKKHKRRGSRRRRRHSSGERKDVDDVFVV